MSEPTPTYENAGVSAILVKRGHEDRDALLDELVALLSATVADVVVKRSLLRRRVLSIRLAIGDVVYVLARGSRGSFEAFRQQTVRGIAVRTDPMPIDAFLAEMGSALDAELRRTEHGREALRAWLGSVGA